MAALGTVDVVAPSTAGVEACFASKFVILSLLSGVAFTGTIKGSRFFDFVPERIASQILGEDSRGAS
jgi:hypothetical protein